MKIFYLIILFLILTSQCKKNCQNGEFFSETDSCICDQCFTGDTCEQRQANCYLWVNVQDCPECRDYWKRILNISSVYIPSDFQISYQTNSSRIGIGPALQTVIRNLHKHVGNVETEGYNIVFGHGGTQLLHAFLYAFHKKLDKRISFFSRIPYYEYCRTYSNLNKEWSIFNSSLFQDQRDVVEYVNIPNNPDGKIHLEPFYKEAPHYLYDLVYYWPHITNVQRKLSPPNMLFSLSKITGHSGSRFGWALVKDIKIAEEMNRYIWYHSHGVSKDSQYRAYKILNSLVEYPHFFYYFIFCYVKKMAKT